MNAHLLHRVRLIVADVLSLPQEHIGPESSPHTIETWDSLQHLNHVIALEQTFGLQFFPDDIEPMTTVERIVSLLERKLSDALSA